MIKKKHIRKAFDMICKLALEALDKSSDTDKKGTVNRNRFSRENLCIEVASFLSYLIDELMRIRRIQ
ncbi:hypothetical protein AAHA92_05697 [Salvia divinorum]|uniref:Ribosomal protein S7 n=1 Tax=Salvia divinorum TaxID=28513 RepID=A0ABD1I5F0_SALDI